MLGYGEITRAALLAAHAREHVLLVGPPGTGKSQWARWLLSHLEGETFSVQLSRWSDETVLFGPPNFRVLREEGRLEYDAQSGLLAATWTFIDEIFDASDVLLRTLLGVLNERLFQRGAFAHHCPLEMAIATANYQRANEMTEAVLDRFLVRLEAPALDDRQRRSLWAEGLPDAPIGHDSLPDLITLQAIYEVRRRAARLVIPADLVAIGRELADREGWSPRRERKAAWLARVAAALRGETRQVRGDDLAAALPLAVTRGPVAQAEAREWIISMTTRAEIEAEQLRALKRIRERGLQTSYEVEGVRTLALLLKEVRALVPITDQVREERDGLIVELERIHSCMLRELELVP